MCYRRTSATQKIDNNNCCQQNNSSNSAVQDLSKASHDRQSDYPLIHRHEIFCIGSPEVLKITKFFSKIVENHKFSGFSSCGRPDQAERRSGTSPIAGTALRLVQLTVSTTIRGFHQALKLRKYVKLPPIPRTFRFKSCPFHRNAACVLGSKVSARYHTGTAPIAQLVEQLTLNP